MHACLTVCAYVPGHARACMCAHPCVCVCSAGLLPPLSPPDFPSAMASCPLHTGVCSSALVQPKHSLTITPLVGLWTVNGHKAQGTPEPSRGFHSLPASLPIILSASPPGKSLKARSHVPSPGSLACLAACTPEGLVTPLPEFPQCLACIPLTALAKWYFRYFCLHSYQGSTWRQLTLSYSAPICRVTESMPTIGPWRP